MKDTKRYRVAADFSEGERDALDALCFSDYRPPAEQLRWLVMQEARRRGLAAPSTNATNPAAKVYEAQTAGFAQCNP